jgi:hypothetical protein
MYRGSGSCDSEEWRDTTTGQSYVYVLRKSCWWLTWWDPNQMPNLTAGGQQGVFFPRNVAKIMRCTCMSYEKVIRSAVNIVPNEIW